MSKVEPGGQDPGTWMVDDVGTRWLFKPEIEGRESAKDAHGKGEVRRVRQFGAAEYAESMTTTIKVSDELRDRLKAQAARDGLTLGAHLARLAEAEDRRHRLLTLQTAVAGTSTEGMKSYAAESASWERTELTDARA